VASFILSKGEIDVNMNVGGFYILSKNKQKGRVMTSKTSELESKTKEYEKNEK
jgi:hypothetical protein